MTNEELKFTSALYNSKEKKTKENNQNNRARVQVTLDVEKKPQALSTPSDFSEYTIENFPDYKTQQ